MLQLLRVALFGAVVWLVGRLVARAARAAGTVNPSASRRGPHARPVPERLVKDPVCGIRLPEGRALRIPTAEGDQFFCSGECRSRFLEGASALR